MITSPRQHVGTPRELESTARGARDLGGQVLLARGLQVRRVSVPPASVEPPDVAHDELGLVVDGPQPRPLEQVLGRAHPAEDDVERSTLVHQLERAIVQVLEELGRLGERLAHALGPFERRAVPREQ